MKYYRILVFGRVQGVGYRYSVRDKAKQLEIKGSVRNLQDGSVEIVCFGADDNIQEFISYCRNNPGWSKVEKIEALPIENKNVQRELESYTSFEIII